jgi:hypothetical protein
VPLFHVGQPVICIDDHIKPAVARVFPQVTNWPVRGNRYIIRQNITSRTREKNGWVSLTFVTVRELTNPRITYMDGRVAEAGFHEIRFVPIDGGHELIEQIRKDVERFMGDDGVEIKPRRKVRKKEDA